MNHELPPHRNLESLKKEAKRWLDELQSAIRTRARLRRASPDASATPTLREVQKALARARVLRGMDAAEGCDQKRSAKSEAGAARHFEAVGCQRSDSAAAPGAHLGSVARCHSPDTPKPRGVFIRGGNGTFAHALRVGRNSCIGSSFWRFPRSSFDADQRPGPGKDASPAVAEEERRRSRPSRLARVRSRHADAHEVPQHQPVWRAGRSARQHHRIADRSSLIGRVIEPEPVELVPLGCCGSFASTAAFVNVRVPSADNAVSTTGQT
jgi:hypothetical protein